MTQTTLRVVLLACSGAPFPAELLAELERIRPDLMPSLVAAVLSQPRLKAISTIPRHRQLAEIYRKQGVSGVVSELGQAVGYRVNGLKVRFVEPLLNTLGSSRPARRIESFLDSRRIPFSYTRNINSPETIERLRSLEPDVVIMATFHHILRRDAIAVAKVATLNVHPSYLPELRGADPINDALRAGMIATGVTIHWVDEGIDTGDIACQARVSVPRGAGESVLRPLLARTGAPLVALCLDSALRDAVPRASQRVPVPA